MLERKRAFTTSIVQGSIIQGNMELYTKTNMKKCDICKQEIKYTTENRENIFGNGYEWTFEDGHSEECLNYRKEEL